MSIVTRIVIAFGVVLGTFFTVAGLSYVELRSIGRELRTLHHGYLPLLRRFTELATLQRQREQHIDEIERQQDPQILRLLERHYPAQAGEKMATLLREASEIADSNWRESETDSARTSLTSVLSQLEGLAGRNKKTTQILAALLTAMRTDNTARVGELRRDLRAEESAQSNDMRAVTNAVEAAIRETVNVAQRRERDGAIFVVAATAVSLLMGLAILVFARRTLAPLRPLTDAARRVAVGDYGARGHVGGAGELGILADEFNKMAKALLDRDARLKQQQRELVEAERLAAVGRISAQIAHEIRNPLNAVGLNAELLDEALTSGDRDAAERALRVIQREIDRLSEITESYLRFGRMPSGPKTVVDVRTVLGEVVDLFSPECAKRGIQVERALDVAAPVEGYENAMRQVFVNLVRNAVEAMKDGGRLRTSVAVQNGNVAIAVSDTGSGIPPEDRERVFDPFFSTKVTGTGLGLPHARQIIREHGGQIRCAPALWGDGRTGTTFFVDLPRREVR